MGVVVEFEAHQATAVDRRMRDQDRPLGAGSAESESPGLASRRQRRRWRSCPGGRDVMNCSTRGIGR